MTQKRTYQLRCPKCGNEQDAALFDSVNVKLAPELKEALMLNQLNVVLCSACDYKFRIDKPLLYNDPDLGHMVYWIPSRGDRSGQGQQNLEEAIRELSALLPAKLEAPHVHLVVSRTELVERIYLLEAGLEERIIEYVKYMIYTQNGGHVDVTHKTLLFNAHDSTPESLCFVVQDVETGKLESVLHYRREAYVALSEMFDQDDQTARLLELFPGPYVSARALLLDEAGVKEDS